MTMPGGFVAVDLETTGLDATSDRIIEIGAVRFLDGEVSGRFETFVDPGIPIPEFVQTLTGIRDADVAGAPSVSRALAELAVFVGDRPVVGHRVSFDLSFLSNAGLELAGPAFDTYDLATVLLPTARRLDLSSLAAALEVPMPVAHRALADAEATGEVFLRLLKKLEGLPRATLLDFQALARQSDWAVGELVDASLSEPGVASLPGAPAELVATASPLPPPLTPREDRRSLEEADVRALFDEVARRPDLMPGFEARAGQVEMAEAVAQTLAHGGQLAVEAGTGTGKSLAYLLPALLYALRNDDRIVVSTHTLNLQEQLAEADVPVAAAIVESVAGVEPGTLRTAVLKGRANYLCRERWVAAREAPGARPVEEARLLARIAHWLPGTSTGDVAELYMRREDRDLWTSLNADGTDCLARRCTFVREGSCFLQRARAEASAAHLVIVNHALLLANVANAEQVLPPFRHLVLDEAHRVEGVATDQYSVVLAVRDLETLLAEIAGRPAVGRSVASRLREASQLDPSPLSPAAGLVSIADELTSAAAELEVRVPLLREAFAAFVEEFAEPTSRDRIVPITTGRRAQPMWADVEEAASQVELALAQLDRRVEQARVHVEALPAGAAPQLDTIRTRLYRAGQSIAGARQTLSQGVLRPDSQGIVWLNEQARGPQLHVAPLDVSEALAEGLYEARDSVIATSATLASGGSFRFSMQALGLPEADTLIVDSPFDYREAVLVLVVDDVPEPSAAGYDDGVRRALRAAVLAAEGRTLALFTSHRAVRATAAGLRSDLGNADIATLAQGVDGTPARLLRELAEHPRSVVLGTAAFWEGVDVRGEALSQIVLARLPFPVPTDPVYAGRAALYEDPFDEYAVPGAVLRFRQGFGRLIRGSTERGVFVVLDRRILTRRYGQAFLDALPDCEVRRVSTSELPAAVSRWLER